MYTVLRCILNVRVSPSLQMLQYSSSPGKGKGAKPTKILIAPCPICLCLSAKKVHGEGERGGAKYPSPSHYDDNEYQYRY